MHGHGVSNEIRPKKAKERLYLQLVLQQKHCTLLTRWSALAL